MWSLCWRLTQYNGALPQLHGAGLTRVTVMQRSAWHFEVLQEHDDLAFSVPSGNIFITQRMLDLLANEDQVAFILAHELAHQISRHAGESIARCAFCTAHLYPKPVLYAATSRLFVLPIHRRAAPPWLFCQACALV